MGTLQIILILILSEQPRLREQTCKPNEKVQKQNGKRKYYFNMSYNLEFPNIRACIKKHEKILEEDPELKERFPDGCFRVTEQRGHKNLKKTSGTIKVQMGRGALE